MLNPSTADHNKLDATTHKVGRLARKWGYGGWEVTNAYAFRSRDYNKVKQYRGDPIGPLNNYFIIRACERADKVCAAWSTMLLGDREQQLIELLTKRFDLHAFDISIKGHPKHPLYIKESNELKIYKAKIQ